MKLLNNIYSKSKITFSIIWIIIYILSFSFGDYLSSLVQINKIFTLIFGLILSFILILFLKKNNLFATYGLRKPISSYKYMLYYLPCIIMLISNLIFGFSCLYSPLETIFYILSMFCVGFLEELIFRGLLFNSMKEDNLKIAIVVSSLTFGIGHIVNLFNPSSDIILTLLQIIYATSAGYMFVMIYHRSNSIIPCIFFHAIFNGLSAFNKGTNNLLLNILSCIFLAIITGGYALYLTLKKDKEKN
jgi:membrane protease YdiL (CAAX protease family)